MEVVGNELLALNDLLTGCQEAEDAYEEVAKIMQALRNLRLTIPS
jgi:hypothetical protein